MTRKSKREIEKIIDDVAPESVDTPKDWVDWQLRKAARDNDTLPSYTKAIGENGEVVDAGEAPPTDYVDIWESKYGAIRIHQSEVPDWIDVEDDLPVSD